MAEDAYANEEQLTVELLRGWSQRALILLGNANAGLLQERRKAILIKINPKLGDMAPKEGSEDTKGLLFGEGLVKGIGKYVGTFMALEKAQGNMRKVFGVFGRASRKGHFTGRGMQRSQYGTQYNAQYGWQNKSRRYQQGTGFYPSRGRTGGQSRRYSRGQGLLNN